MKRNYDMKQGIFVFLMAMGALLLASCEADPVDTTRGELPDREPLENTYARLRSTRSATNIAVIGLTEGNSTDEDYIYCGLTQAAKNDMQVSVHADMDLVEVYNQKYGTELEPFPSENVEFSEMGNLHIAAGEKFSDRITVSVKSDGIAEGTYLLPITIASDNVAFSEENQVIYYGVKVRGVSVGEYDLDTDYVSVFYLNTTDYQPLLADIWTLEKIEMPSFQTLWKHLLGNIINLRVVRIGYDATTGRALLDLNSDIRYVLEHTDKYIRPLQDKGRKVCLSIEGGNTGLGFCNLSDAQIADFAAQVKSCLETYDLDGVNLWDRNSGYGEVEGMPAMNTTSYPKLIKALRETLGSDKLVTLTDYEEPTEYFWDTEATGGIEVGQYLDYAWSGYMDPNEELQIVDPYVDADMAAQYGIILHDRKVIAGLPRDRFGSVAMPWYPLTSPILNDPNMTCYVNVGMWAMMFPERSKVVVYSDLITLMQGAEWEGAMRMVPSIFWGVAFGEGALEGTFYYNTDVLNTYNGGVPFEYGHLEKDW